MTDEFVNTLPQFLAVRDEEYPKWLNVTCPRCENMFSVVEKEWLRPRRYQTRSGKTIVITGRSCPYCFRAGRIPARRPEKG